jgi:hypothetical protein
MVELPTGTVAFLFTDVEGSSRLWESDPESMAAAAGKAGHCWERMGFRGADGRRDRPNEAAVLARGALEAFTRP